MSQTGAITGADTATGGRTSWDIPGQNEPSTACAWSVWLLLVDSHGAGSADHGGGSC